MASCHLYYDILFLEFPWLFRSLWSAGVVHFLALLFPTALMGMSLPFLVRATVSNPVTAPRTIGYLYGLNVFGGALGALLAPWVYASGMMGFAVAWASCSLLTWVVVSGSPAALHLAGSHVSRDSERT